MKQFDELATRLALKRRRQLNNLSDEAFGELEIAVRENPQNFVEDNEDEAYYLLVQALQRYAESLKDDDLLDDEAYLKKRRRRLDLLAQACKQALELDEDCIDAEVIALSATDRGADSIFSGLMDIEKHVIERQGHLNVPASGDAWTDVFLRPRVRLMSRIAISALNTARFRIAVERCGDLLAKAPLDAVGARFTCSLAMARLEDEEGFLWLDSRDRKYSRSGNAWFHLSRTLLMYKLGRMPAARRALAGFDRLCVGGAYLLLQPMFVEPYLLDRPEFVPGSFGESVLAVYESDPIVADLPDLVMWAREQKGFLASAQDYCKRSGLEWREW